MSKRRRAVEVDESKNGEKKQAVSAGSSSSSSSGAQVLLPGRDMEKAIREDWNAEEELAEKMIPLMGKLYRRQNIITTLFGTVLNNATPVDILRMHSQASIDFGIQVTVSDTFPIAEALAEAHFKVGRTLGILAGVGYLAVG